MPLRSLFMASGVLFGLAVLLSVSPGVSTSHAAVAPPSPDLAFRQMGSMPLAFTKNVGQWDETVLFRSSSGGVTVWFCRDGIYYQFTHQTANSGSDVGGLSKAQAPDASSAQATIPGNTQTILVSAKFVNANVTVEADGQNLLEYKCNYFLGSDPANWHTDVPNFGGIVYHDVYPGLDARFTGAGGQLVAHWDAKTGADNSQIKFRYESNAVVTATGTDQVLIETPWGDRLQFSTKHALPESEFMAGSGATKEIDVAPSLLYSSFLGHSSNDEGYGIAVNGAGKIFVAGSTRSISFPTQDPYDGSFNGNSDVFVTKLTASGSAPEYSTFIGGNSADVCYGIALDPDGYTYITGWTSSTNFPTESAFDGSFNGSSDAFVTKLAPDGNALEYSTYLGGSLNDGGYAVALDQANNAIVTGYAYSPLFPQMDGWDSEHNGGSDVFVTRLNAGGGLEYGTFLGGEEDDAGYGIAIDQEGSIYVTGSTFKSGDPNLYSFPTRNALDNTHNGDFDAFACKLNGSGDTLEYSTLLGDFLSEGFAIAVDSERNAYVTGSGSSVIKLAPGGNSLRYNIPQGAVPVHGIAVDAAGRAHIIGWSNSSVVVTRLSATGTGEYSTTLGGNSVDEGYAIALDANGDMYLTGRTSSSDFPTSHAFDASYNGGLDAFVAKIGLQNAPILDPIGFQQAAEDQLLTFGVSASDPNGTIPSISATELPAGATFSDNNNGTGTFSWTPTSTQSGTYNVTFAASDGDLTVQEEVLITVSLCATELTWEQVVPAATGTVEVMQGGVAYRYIELRDASDNQKITGAVIHLETEEIVSDDKGLYRIPIRADVFGNIVGPAQLWDEVESATSCGQTALFAEPVQFDVSVTPRQYEKSYDILTQLSVSGGLVTGAQAGPIGISGPRMSVTGSLGMGVMVKFLKNHGSSDILIISRRIEESAGGELSIGKIALGLRLGSLGSLSGRLVGVQRQEFVFDNPYLDPDQKKAQTALLLETMVVGSMPLSPAVGVVLTVLTESILSSSGASQLVWDSEDLRGAMCGLEGSFNLGFRSDILNEAISRRVDMVFPSAAGDLFCHVNQDSYKHSSFGDQHPGAEYGRSVKMGLTLDASTIKSSIAFGLTLLSGDDATRFFSLMPSTEDRIGGFIEMGRDFDANWNPLTGYVTWASDDLTYSPLTTIHTFSKFRLHLQGPQLETLAQLPACNLARLDGPAPSIHLGNASIEDDYVSTVTSIVEMAYGNAANTATQATESDATPSLSQTVEYSRNQEIVKATDIRFEVPIPPISVGGGLTVTDGKEYVSQSGVMRDGVFPLEEYEEDQFVQVDGRDFAAIISGMLSGIVPLLGDALANATREFVETVSEVGEAIVQTADNIAQGGARLAASAWNNASGAVITLTEFLPDWPFMNANGKIERRNYKVRSPLPPTIEKFGDNTGEVVVTAVGKAFQAGVVDSSGSSISLYDPPLELTIVVSDSQLMAAGYPTSDRNQLAIFMWDQDSAYARSLATLTSGDSLFANIDRGGQYFSGISGYPPDVIPPSIDSVGTGAGDTVLFRQIVGVWVSDTGQVSSGLDLNHALSIVHGDSLSVSFELYDLRHGVLWLIPMPDSAWALGRDSVRVVIADDSGHHVDSLIGFGVACQCDCHADPQCDSIISDIFDVTIAVDVAFRNGLTFTETNCLYQTTDVNCDGVTDIFDVTKIVNVAFRNADPAVEFCAPPCR